MKSLLLPLLFCFCFLDLVGLNVEEGCQYYHKQIDSHFHQYSSSICMCNPTSDSLALVAFYNATIGGSWTNTLNNIDPWLVPGTPIEDWFGVTTNVSGCVESIFMNQNNVDGSIPIDFGNLSDIISLELYGNSLSGDFPTALTNLTSLEVLNIGWNQHSGTIPVDIQNLINLTTFGVHQNFFSGNIPPELGQLTNLTNLSLNFNRFGGNIPNTLSNLVNLEFFFAQENFSAGIPGSGISGSIPNWLGSLPNLQRINLGDNIMIGNIPIEIGDLTSLTSFSVRNNNLTGNIPLELGNLSNLTYFDLSFNNLDGNIPGELGNLTNLTHFLIQDNNLEGCLSQNLQNLCPILIEGNISNNPNLNNQDWSTFCNNQTGICCTHPDKPALIALYEASNGDNWTVSWDTTSCDICTWYGIDCDGNDRVICVDLDGDPNCSLSTNGGNNLNGNLIDINLPFLEGFYLSSNNNISGNIPDFSNVPNLKHLRIGVSLLSGSVPDFSVIPNLETLMLNFNDLTGSIPDFTNLSNLTHLYIAGNNLDGNLPDFSNVANLQVLSCSQNSLTGSIPEFLNLPSLNLFSCSSNQLEGCFPSFTCGLSLFDATFNVAMPWQGDHTNFCNGDPQIGAPCDDSNALTSGETIQPDCSCAFVANSNDDCANAIQLTPLPSVGNQSEYGSYDNLTASADTAPSCFSIDAFVTDGVWFELTGDGGIYDIWISDCAAGVTDPLINIQLGIYEGNCGGLTEVVCNENAGTPSTTLNTTNGTTYYLLIDGISGETGEFCVDITNVDPCVPPYVSADGTTAYVTTTDDSGLGSLRQAIECANADANLDNIEFNLSGGAPYIINLLSSLPSLDDLGISIDGTSQLGYNLGDIKINGTGLDPVLQINSDFCSIQGIHFSECGATCIDILGDNLQFGNTDKGNIVTSSASTVVAIDCQNSRNNLTFTDNRIGVDENGVVDGGDYTGIRITDPSGGNHTISDNWIVVTNFGLNLINQTSGNNTISNNYFGTDENGNNPLMALTSGMNIQNTPANISGNVINSTATGVQAGAGCQVFNNFIGVGANGITNLSSGGSGISISQFAGHATVGPNNLIANYNIGVSVASPGVTAQITQNSIFCNSATGILFNSGATANTSPSITTSTTAEISGTSDPNNTIEIFLHDETGCIGAPCQGKTFIGSTTADGAGNWTFTPTGISINDEVTATATDASNNTSEFSICATVQNPCPNYTADLGGSATICPNGSTDISFTFSGGTAPFTVDWTNGTFMTSNNPEFQTVNPLSTTTYTLTSVTDADGCAANIGTSATITVEDTSAPNANCIAAGSIYFISGTSVNVNATDLDAGSTDDCSSIANLQYSFSQNVNDNTQTFNCNDLGTQFLNLWVTDESGNQGMCATSVEIQDNGIPVAVCQDLTLELDGTGNAIISAGQVDVGSSDNCDISLDLSLSQTNFTCADVGTQMITLTATDDSLNEGNCDANITVEDGLPDINSILIAANNNCIGEIATVNFSNVEEDGNWEFTYNLSGANNSGSATQIINISGGSGVLILDAGIFQNSGTNNFELTAIGNGSCTQTSSIITTFETNQPPTFSNLNETCVGDGTYFVTFILNGTSPFTLVSGNGNISGNNFSSDPINSGEAYNFEITDAANCGSLIVTGSENCGCVTSAGTMDFNNTPIEVCETGIATAIHNADEMLFGNDILEFIIHDNPGATTGNILGFNATNPSFGIQNGMQTGTTYYISAIAADEHGAGGIDYDDPCLDVAPGVPVIFQAEPTATLSGNEIICEGENADLMIILNGSIPFTIDYTINNIPQPSITTSNFNYILSIFPTAGSNAVELTSVSDAVCNSGTVSGSASVFVNTQPISTLNGDGSICENTNEIIEVTINLTGTPNWELNWTIDNIPQPILNITNSPFILEIDETQAGIIEITDVTDGNGCFNSGDGSTATITVSPSPIVELGDNQTACTGETITLDAGNAGANFNWSTGATNQSIEVTSSGIYTVTVTENNCSATDAVQVSFEDTEFPTVNCPADLTATTVSGNTSIIVNNIPPIADDNCNVASIGYTLTGTTLGNGIDDASGTDFNIGLTTVEYQVTDDAGNQNSCDFEVTVELGVLSCREADSLTLVTFYNAMGGGSWLTNWVLSQPMTEWEGVHLDGNGCVICLDLDGVDDCNFNLQNNISQSGGNGLSGQIPAAIGDLASLEFLSIENDAIFGFIPPEIGQLTNLTSLNISLTNISSSLPPQFTQLSQLQFLALIDNNLSGEIPDLTNYPNVEFAHFGWNKFTGDIPALNPALLDFNCDSNLLTGNIPVFTSDNASLQGFDCSRNNLTGSIQGINELQNLVKFLCWNNELENEIPALNNNPNLVLFSGGHNNFSGEIPALDNNPSLQEFYCQDNQLTGSIPGFTNNPNLSIFLCYQNNLDGVVPSLPSVGKRFYLYENQMTFEDILPNFDFNETTIAGNAQIGDDIFWYAQQDSVYTDTIITVTEGNPLTVDLGFDENEGENLYQWYHDGTPLDPITGINKLIFPAIQADDAGNYWVHITNAGAPELTLESFNIVINVNSSPCSFSCPDTINISVLAGSIHPDMIAIENLNDSCPDGNFQLEIFDNNGQSIQGPNVFLNTSCDLVTQELTIQLTDTGSSTICSSTLAIFDELSPGIVCPNNTLFQTGAGTLDLEVFDIDPIFDDNCSAELSYTLTDATTGSSNGSASGQTFELGTTIVEYTVTDLSGNTNTCSFNVILEPLPSLKLKAFCGMVPEGENITINIEVEDFTNLTNSIFGLQFETAYLEFIEFTNLNSTLGLTSDNFNVTNIGDGLIIFDWENDSGASLADNEVLFSITFKAIGSNGTMTEIAFEDPFSAIHLNGEFIGTNSSNCTIEIEEPAAPQDSLSIYLDSGIANLGEIICLNVTSQNFEEVTILGFDLDIDFNILNYNSIIDGALDPIAEMEGDSLVIFWFDLNGVTVPDGETLFQICFEIIGEPCGSSDLIFDEELFMINSNANDYQVLNLQNAMVEVANSLSAEINAEPTTCGENNGSATLTINGGTGNESINWSSGEMNVLSISNLAPDNYFVIIQDGQCLDTLTFEIAPSTNSLSIDLGNDTLICLGNSITLDAENADCPNCTYSWSDDNTITEPTRTIFPDSPISISVIVTDENECFATDEIFIDVLDLPENPSFSGIIDVCDGDIEIFSINNFNSNQTYNWQLPDGSNEVSFINNQLTIDFSAAINGDLCLTTENICGASENICIPITVNNIPIQPILTSGETTTCEGESIIYCIENITNADNYIWNLPSGTVTNNQICQTILWEAGSVSSFSVTAQNECGSSQLLEIPVTIFERPTATLLSENQILCAGNPFELVIEFAGTPPFSLTYFDGSQNVDLNNISENPLYIPLIANQTANYTLVTVSDIYCEGDVAGNFNIFIEDAFQTNLNEIICEGDSYDFNGEILTETGIYQDTFSTFNGCDSILILNLTVENLLEIIAEDDEYDFADENEILVLDVIENDILPDVGWSIYITSDQTEAGRIELTDDNIIEYQLEENDFVGLDSFPYILCQNSCPDNCDTAFVRLNFDEPCINDAIKNFPTGMTPDNDGFNDTFHPLLEFEELGCPLDPNLVELIIANRWGEIVFKSKPYPKDGWDGSQKNDAGRLLPQATYYYVLKIPQGDKTRTVKGTIHLIH